MRRIHAPSLIELSIQTLQKEFQSQKSLTGQQRYALAMVMGALNTARSEILTEPDAAQWQLLDYVYDDGEGTVAQLARDIRSRTVSDATHAELRQRLEALLFAELETRNPAAL
ncbi:MAG: hypothetical protein KKB37_11695, partial [Alphaproteobacteria bacterium]|nr:hypothetical protein [Alphaproteobacteria bacterium]